MDWVGIIINVVVLAIGLSIRDDFRDARIKKEAKLELFREIGENFKKLIKEKQGE